MEIIMLKIIYYALFIIGFSTIGVFILEIFDRIILAIIRRLKIYPMLVDFIIERSRKRKYKNQ